MKFSFVKNKYKFLLLPLAIIVAGIIGLIIAHGFNMDVDFAGGIKLETNLSMKLDKEALEAQKAEAENADKEATDEEAADEETSGEAEADEETKADDAAADEEAANEEAADEEAEDGGEAADVEAADEEAEDGEAAANEEAADEDASSNIYANTGKLTEAAEPYKTVATNVDNSEVEEIAKSVPGIANIKIQKSGDSTYLIKATAVNSEAEDPEQEVLDALKAALTEKYDLSNAAFLNESKTTPTFGSQIRSKAVVFTLIALFCILLYIAIRFEWRAAVMAIVALFINVLVMAAIYGFTQIPLNTTFIAAMLTVVGYSINDTIVIFDRIRENTKKAKSSVSILDVVDKSIHECLGRTISTSITTLVTIVLLYIIGVTAIKDFALPLIIGITIGTFTSICIASPFWASWKETDRLAKLEAAKANKKKK